MHLPKLSHGCIHQWEARLSTLPAMQLLSSARPGLMLVVRPDAHLHRTTGAHWAAFRVCNPTWSYQSAAQMRIHFCWEAEKKWAKKHESLSTSTEHQNSQVSDAKRCSAWQTKTHGPSGRMRLRTTIQLWVGLQSGPRTGLWKCATLVAGDGKTVKFLWTGRWWRETVELCVISPSSKSNDLVIGKIRNGCWTLFEW